jgi:hypothetical protein
MDYWQDRSFQNISLLLFDGESGLRSSRVQTLLANKYQLKIRSEILYKRNLAERMIREIKLRMALLLHMEGGLGFNNAWFFFLLKKCGV